MLVSLRKNGLTSLFKEVRVFKVRDCTQTGCRSESFSKLQTHPDLHSQV